MGIIFWAVIFGVLVWGILFAYNLSRSLAFTLKATVLPKFTELALLKEDRRARLAKLPIVARPVNVYCRRSGRVGSEFGDFALEKHLEEFENFMLAMEDPRMFFGCIARQSKDENSVSSMIIGMQSTLFTRFLAWVEIHPHGALTEWRLMFSEVRILRTPLESLSHFEGSKGQNHCENVISELFSLATGGYTTDKNANNAKWFEQSIVELWIRSLALVVSGENVFANESSASSHQSLRPRGESNSEDVRRSTRKKVE